MSMFNGEQTGRTLAGTANTLAFDYDGQLKSITQGTNVTSFSYDALGRRMSRTPAGGSTTDTQFMGSAPLTESVGGTYTAAYTYGNDQLRRNGEYPQFDGTGSVRGETSSSQAVTYTQNTDSFGNQVGSSGSTSSSAKFAGDWGYQTDGDAGLVHVGARYYDPQVGSFATRDTMLDQIPYAYCGHDPVDWADPSGHFGGPQEVIGVIMGGVGESLYLGGDAVTIGIIGISLPEIGIGLLVVGALVGIWGIVEDITDGGGMVSWIGHLIGVQMPSDPRHVYPPPGVGSGVPGSRAPKRAGAL